MSLLTKFGVFKKLLEFNDSFFIQLVSLLNFMNGISFIYFFLSKTPTANLAKGMTERQLSNITLLNVKLAEKHHKFWRLDTTFALVSCPQRRCFNARFRLQACLPLAGFDFRLKERSLFNEENVTKSQFFLQT